MYADVTLREKPSHMGKSLDMTGFLAERVGFEPTVPLPVHLISSQGRYNHFDTAPYVCCSLSIIAGTGSKIKEIFRRFTCV